MRFLVLLMLVTGVAYAEESASPIRISVDCEDYGRTKACSAFLTGFIEANKLFIAAPRSDADVILYVNANEVALIDKVHLRFVSKMQGPPSVIELDVDIDTRADDDTQRAQLEPAFLRGIALYVAARHPKAVTVAIQAGDDVQVKKPKTTPWGFSMDFGGSGNYTENFQNYNGFSNANVSRTTARDKATLFVFGNGGLNRQPPLIDPDDGSEISLNTSQWTIGLGGEGSWIYNRCYSIGGESEIFKTDDKGQFAYNWTSRFGLEWDKFKPDDPRGNRLAVAYLVGYVVEKYNVRNELGEGFAQYPTHEIVATGSVRKDKVTFGLSVQVRGEIIHPMRRHTLSASPNIEVQIGTHVDIGAGFSIAKRELPGPDEDAIDPSDFERLSRLSYADPLQINGFFNVRIHWDRTNGVRNDRFDNL